MPFHLQRSADGSVVATFPWPGRHRDSNWGTRFLEVNVGTETALHEASPASRPGVSSLPNWSETARTAGTVTASMLTIVIPALNEQESIGLTIQRCLDARERIRRIG